MAGRGQAKAAQRRRRFDRQADDRRPHKIGGLSIAEFMLAKSPRGRKDEEEAR